MDANSILRLQSVHPVLAAKVKELCAELSRLGIEIRVTQGLRTCSEQDKLYNQGRTTQGKIVTNAAAGHSWHNFGMAVDVVPDDTSIAGFQCDWNVQHPAWKRIHEVAESLGLTCGADFRTFPDWPHLQLTGRFPVNPDGEVRSLFKCGGVQAVWKESGL